MSKFKVGDKVRILDNSTGGNHPIGSIGSVIDVYRGCNDVCIQGIDWNYVDESLELVKEIPIETNTEVYYITKSMIDEINGTVSTINEKEEFIPDETQEKYYKEYYGKFYPEIKEVLFKGEKTIVKLHDSRVGCVIRQDDDEFDYKEGVLLAFIKALRKSYNGYGFKYNTLYRTHVGENGIVTYEEVR